MSENHSELACGIIQFMLDNGFECGPHSWGGAETLTVSRSEPNHSTFHFNVAVDGSTVVSDKRRYDLVDEGELSKLLCEIRLEFAESRYVRRLMYIEDRKFLDLLQNFAP